MATIVGVALPFFAVLLCGMLAARLRLLDDAGLMGLNAFVFWFALPALLFHKVAATPFARLTDWTLYVGYEGAACCCTGGAGRPCAGVARRSLQEAAICAFAASWGNVGYMGVPLLIAAYGEAAALPACWPWCWTRWSCRASPSCCWKAAAPPARAGLRVVARAVARNPLILAVFAGAIVAWLGVGLPTPVTGFLGLLGPAAAAGALFALGATLRGGALIQDKTLVAGVTLTKLLLLPALAWLGAHGDPGTDRPARRPCWSPPPCRRAASVFVIAQRYGVLERQVAAIVFVSHLLGILTLTGVLVLLQP